MNIQSFVIKLNIDARQFRAETLLRHSQNVWFARASYLK
jgi:hypothetical protein